MVLSFVGLRAHNIRTNLLKFSPKELAMLVKAVQSSPVGKEEVPKELKAKAIEYNIALKNGVMPADICRAIRSESYKKGVTMNSERERELKRAKKVKDGLSGLSTAELEQLVEVVRNRSVKNSMVPENLYPKMLALGFIKPKGCLREDVYDALKARNTST